MLLSTVSGPAVRQVPDGGGHEPPPTLPGPPVDSQAAGASGRQGPFSAAWNPGEAGLIPLDGPNWPPLPLGSGKSGTPCARMHRANATVKLPAVPPWPPPLEEFPPPPVPDWPGGGVVVVFDGFGPPEQAAATSTRPARTAAPSCRSGRRSHRVRGDGPAVFRAVAGLSAGIVCMSPSSSRLWHVRWSDTTKPVVSAAERKPLRRCYRSSGTMRPGEGIGRSALGPVPAHARRGCRG